MKESDSLYIELSHYFEKGKLNTITSQKEKEHVLENLRVKIFEFLESNLHIFSEDIFDFIFEGLNKLGIEFEDLFSTPKDVNEKIIGVLFDLTLKEMYWETRYYLVSIIKNICEILVDFKDEEVFIFNYLKRKIAYFLVNYDFKAIQDLWDEGIFNYLEEQELFQIYKNPKADFEKKLYIALYETEGNWLSTSAEVAIDIYIKLGEYGITPLLRWGSQSYVEELGTEIYRFFKKMGEKIVRPFKICIAKSLLDRKFITIDKLMNPELIELLDKKIIIEIFWKDNTLEHFINLCLEMRADIYGDRIVKIIRKIGGDAFKLLHKAFKLNFFTELLVDVVNDFKKTEVEEIPNLKEGILYANKINDMVFPLIVILCDSLIGRISDEEKRSIILNTNIIEFILETRFPYPFQNPLERLQLYVHETLREKISNIFMEPNIVAIARFLKNHSYYLLLRGKILDTRNWKRIIENPNKNFFETLTEVINYIIQNFDEDWHPVDSYGLFHKFLLASLFDTIKIKIIDSFKQKNVKAIFSIFELGLKKCFNKQELFTLIEDSIDLCIISQSENYARDLQDVINELFKKDQDAFREILNRILKNNSKYSEKISKYALNKGYLK